MTPIPITSVWCGTLLTPIECLHKRNVVIADGKIIGITSARAHDCLDAFDGIVIPGLVDIQVNGALGHSFQADERAYLDAIVDFHLRAGTITLLPTLITAAEATLVRSLSTLANYLDQPSRATLPCIHLEGPFLSPAKRGAHDDAALRLPDLALMQRFCAAARDKIGLVTLAPELRGSRAVIQYLAERGVVVSAGHSAATFDEISIAVEAGLSLVTHAGNASDWPHRAMNALGFMGSEPGVVGSLLALPQLRGSLILDGFHVHPALLPPLLKVKGADGLILTSDASTVVGCTPGDYEGGGLSATVDPRGFALSRRGGNVLAGSVITLLTAIQRAVQLANLSLGDAVTMATLTPARALRLDHGKGAIGIGADADLLVLNTDLTLRHVIAGGMLIV